MKQSVSSRGFSETNIGEHENIPPNVLNVFSDCLFDVITMGNWLEERWGKGLSSKQQDCLADIRQANTMIQEAVKQLKA